MTGLLGQGGMGAVYIAEHTLLGRKAAIKVLLPAYSRDAEIVRRFFNEAKAVTQISDPGIVQVFDFGADAEGAYIVMELLDGETVAGRVRRLGAMPALDVVRMLRLVCVALHAAHAKGIIHRDLKPENLFIVADPGVAGGQRAKVLDFGIAKLSRDEAAVNLTRTGMMMGTPQYMSPEQCLGAGEIDHRSDIYSLGCVMFEMLAARPPFEGRGSGELVIAHLQRPPPHVAPPAIDDIVQRCLAKDPDDRFASMAELADALLGAEDALSFGGPTPLPFPREPTPTPMPLPPPGPGSGPGTPTTLTAASGMSAPQPPPRRRRFVVIAAAAFVTCAVVIVLATHGDHSAPGSGGSGGARAPDSATDMAPAARPPAPPADASIADATAAADAPVEVPDALPAKKPGTSHTHEETHPHAHKTSSNVDRND